MSRPSSVDPVMSENRTVTVLRDAGRPADASSAEPHASQNLAPARFSLLHVGQAATGRSVALGGRRVLPSCPNSLWVPRWRFRVSREVMAEGRSILERRRAISPTRCGPLASREPLSGRRVHMRKTLAVLGGIVLLASVSGIPASASSSRLEPSEKLLCSEG